MQTIFQNRLPDFYFDVIKTWFKLRDKVYKENNFTENEIIWGNKHIRYNGKILYNSKWIQAGIISIKDIVTGKRFINLAELSNRVNFASNIFDLHKIDISYSKRMERENK